MALTDFRLGSAKYPINYSADNSTIVQQAINDAALIGGATVELTDRLIPIKTVALKKLVVLQGKGFNSGFVSIANNTTLTGMITIHDYGTTGGHHFYADRWQLNNFAINGNKTNQGANVTDGLHLDASDGYFGNESVADNGDYTASLMSGSYVDCFGRISNLFITGCSGIGLNIPVASVGIQRAMSCIMDNIIVKNCTGRGMSINSSDNIFSNVYIGGTGGHGIYVNGGNNRFGNSKVYFCLANVSGIYLDASSIGTVFEGVETQEQYSTGITLHDCDNVSITGLVSEGHGHDGETSNPSPPYTGVAIVLDGCNNCTVEGKICNRNSLYGNINVATQWVNSPKFNDVDLQINGPGGTNLSRPIPYFAVESVETPVEILPPITNTLRINNVDRHLPNIMAKSSRVFGDTNANNIADGWQVTNQTGITAATSYDTTEQCQKINLTVAGRGVTFTNATNLVNLTSHGFTEGTVVQFGTAGTLPAELSVNTNYYVRTVLTHTFQVATTNSDVTIVDFSDDGSGTMYVQDMTKSALVYVEMPISEGDIVSVAAEGRCEAGLSFKIALNTYAGTPLSSTYKNNSNGNTITPTDVAGGMWNWSIISKYTIPDATPNAVFMRLQFAITPTAPGAQNLDAYLRNIIVTVESERNEKVIWKWTTSPSGEFMPQYIGQKYLDTTNNAIYEGVGFTTTSWRALCSDWTTWSPTVVWGTATPEGSVAQVARYKRVGNICYFNYSYTATDGNDASSLTITLPVTPVDNNSIITLAAQQKVNATWSNPLAYIDDDSGGIAFRSLSTCTNAVAVEVIVSGFYEVA